MASHAAVLPAGLPVTPAKELSPQETALDAYVDRHFEDQVGFHLELAAKLSNQWGLLLYEYCEGIEKSIESAMQRYTSAAENGNADAQYTLCVMYDEGEEIKQDFVAVLKRYRMVAAQGNYQAMSNIGNMYETGVGAELDFAKAFRWFDMALPGGHPIMQMNLAIMYDQGKGVPQDFGRALELYQLSALQNHAEA